MTTPLQVVLSILKDGGRAVTQSGEGYAARCPAHNDRSPSLSVSEGDDGRVLLHCHAGCEAGAVVAALGLTMADLYPPRDGHATGNGRTRPTGSRAPTPRRFVATYPYHDASGELLYEVVRYEPKDFRPRRPDPAARDGWAYSYGDTPRVLYRLPDILTADHGSLVFVPEGEKDADRICREGLVATTTPGGANGAGKVDLSPLAGRDVVLLPDHDAAGEGYAADLHRRLAELDPPARVRVLRLPGLREKGDVSGWMDAALEHDGEALLRLAEVCPVTQPDAAGETVGDQSARSAHCAGDEGEAWREPTPLHVRPDLPTLPLADMFPPGLEPIRDFIAAVAEARQVPPELPAMLVPPVACVAAAGKVMFERVNGHREPPALWSLVLLGSGNRKSGTFADLLAPVMRWQRDETTRLGPIIARQHEGRKVDEARLTRLRADAAKAKPDEAARMREEAVALAAHMAEEELDVVPQLVAGDATPEAAGELLMRNRERLLLAAPEADALDVMLGRYNRGQANFGLFQAGHAGDAFSDVRRGRAGTRLERPALSVALTVQPEAVAELFGNRQASGRGLLARFLTVAPRSLKGYRAIDPPPVPGRLRDAWCRAIVRLLDADLPGEPLGIAPDAEAEGLYLDFQRWREPELRPGGSLSERIEGWAEKLEGVVARLALMLHALQWGLTGRLEPTIDADTMRAALAWLPFLLEHERIVAGEVGADPAREKAARVLRWLIDRPPEVSELGVFTRRDCFSAVRNASTIRRVADLEPALELLGEHGYIRELGVPEREGPGRKPSEQWQVNPRWTPEREGGEA